MKTMDRIRELTLKRHPLKKYPIQVGDTAKVHMKIKEGSKERVQIFEGVILKIQGKDYTRSFTIRKVSQGVGVEKTIPLASPNIANIEVLSKAKVRRARLFYLRSLKGRSARLSSKQFASLAKTPTKEDEEKDLDSQEPAVPITPEETSEKKA